MKREILASRPVILVTTVVAALAIGGCGSGDNGGERINSCAAAEGVANLNPAWQVKNTGQADVAMQGAVASVLEHTHQTSTVAAEADQLHIESVDPGYLPLANAIFRFSYPWFDVSDETKLDDKSEEFCYDEFNNGDVYYTPRAEAVIQGLVQRGVHIQTDSYSRAFDRLIAGIAQGNEEPLSDFAH